MRWASFLLLGLAFYTLAQDAFRPQVELVRKDKRVVAWVSGEEGSLFYADYGDIWVGALEALSEEKAQVGGRTFFLDAGSSVEEGLEVGEKVEVAFNPDWERDGLPYLMRLRKAGEEKAARYLRLVLFDPKDVEVRLGEEVEARGPLAVVERGGVEELVLTGGDARYLEEEGRLEVKPAPGRVVVVQGGGAGGGAEAPLPKRHRGGLLGRTFGGAAGRGEAPFR